MPLENLHLVGSFEGIETAGGISESVASPCRARTERPGLAVTWQEFDARRLREASCFSPQTPSVGRATRGTSDRVCFRVPR